MSSLYSQTLNYSPARAASPHIRTNPDVDSQYLTELLAERQKLGPFIQVLPICSRLLNQEILRVSGMIPNQGFSDYDRLQRGSPSPMSTLDAIPDMGGKGVGRWNGNGWNGLQQEVTSAALGFDGGLRHRAARCPCNFMARLAGPQGLNMDWQGAPGSPSSYIAKRVLRLEIPVGNYPNFNFVGRLLGPRGNSLKRVEASTGCRVFIRGKGSIKDPDKEESLRGRPGYEHLNDPLHILIEAELPANVIDVRLRQAQEIIEELLKPVDESLDLYKRQQLRELAMLNSNFREESPQPRGSVSPFGSSGLKRAKTGW
ncbi:hypothetical protein RJ639_028261 [Escallonia herrerae]|uniref:K Homology domain-containing protein n=1 Tax=Escallonia herrerae TaxID=1293975 RepID=A0AA89BGB5_9ASTE|nr:hypothetical protein RJ639_028261 [Escallonia herrerae]